MTQTIPVHGVKLHRELQVRVTGTNADTVEDYRQALLAGERFPPIVVYEIDGAYILVDGWHRHRAHKEAAITEIEAEILTGTYAEAKDYVLYQANRKNGQRLSRSDKLRIVEETVRNVSFAQQSDRKVAKVCGVSHVMVGSVRHRLGITPDSSIGADGRIRVRKRGESLKYEMGEPPAGPDSPSNHGMAILTGKLTSSAKAAASRLSEFTAYLTDEDVTRITETIAKLQEIMSHEA